MMSPTVREIIEAMPSVLQPAEAGDLVADIQFKFTGQEPGAYFLHIEKGQCTFNEGVSPSPRTTVNCASEVWQAITAGTLDPFQAFMQGKLQIQGDMGIALRLQRLFQVK
jgi:putative sterol carrier protein